MGFAADLKKWAEAAKVRPEQVIRKVVVDLHAGVVIRTPVDTGRARGNWQVSLDAPEIRQAPDIDPSGRATIGKVATLIASQTLSGRTVYVVNSLPYIRRLEYGHSAQAPAGMVAVTLAEFRQRVAEAARAVR